MIVCFSGGVARNVFLGSKRRRSGGTEVLIGLSPPPTTRSGEANDFSKKMIVEIIL